MMALLNNAKYAQRQVDNWNKHYPVGQAVTVRRDNGATLTTKTRSPAELLSGHSAVVWVEGISGCYLLNRVAPVTEGAHG